MHHICIVIPTGGGVFFAAGLEGPAVRPAVEFLSAASKPQIPRLRYDAARLRSARDDNSKKGFLSAQLKVEP